MYLHFTLLCPWFHYLYMFFKNNLRSLEYHLKTYFLGMNLCVFLLEHSFPSLCLTLTHSSNPHINSFTKDIFPSSPGKAVQACTMLSLAFPNAALVTLIFYCLCSSLHSPLDHKLSEERHYVNSPKHNICHIAVT